MTETQILRIVEAALLCADQALSITELRKLFASEGVSGDDLRRHLATLQINYAEKGVQLVNVASGWRFQSRPIGALVRRPYRLLPHLVHPANVALQVGQLRLWHLGFVTTPCRE